METPFCVSPICPAANAWLLLAPFHDIVPAIIVSCIAFAYSSAARVSRLSIATTPSSSTSFAPCDHSSQCAYPGASPGAWLSANPHGCPIAFSLRHSVRNCCRSFGTFSNPASRTHEMRKLHGPDVPPIGSPSHSLPRHFRPHSVARSYHPPYFRPR